MNEKLEGYKAEPIGDTPEARKENADIEAAEKETLEPELKPDPETVVPTGDEEAPVEQPVHESGMKALYDKSRKNRDLVTREDAEGAPDVEMIQRLTAEAAGGEAPADGVDTNRPDRLDPEPDPEPEYVEEDPDTEFEAGTDEPEIVNEEGVDEPSSLSAPAPDDRVSVKILGKHYDVPQQDIDDAGGLEAYQKNRAATIRLQRAATLEQRALKRAQQASATVSPPQPDQHDDPSPDGQGEAEQVSVHELQAEMMDVVISGEDEDIRAWIEKRLTKAPAPAERKADPPPPPAEVADEPDEDSEILQELQAQSELDVEETNVMMREEFPDIMAGGQPNATALQRRRLDDAQEYFGVLISDPHNEGRSQKDMAREAAYRARRIRYPEELSAGDREVPPAEQERRKRIERKRRMPQPSRADRAAPDNRKQEKTTPSRKQHLQRLRRHAGLDLGEEDLSR